MKLLDKILVALGLLIFVAMVVLEFIPIGQLAHIIIGAVAGIYFLGCLIYFALRNNKRK